MSVVASSRPSLELLPAPRLALWPVHSKTALYPLQEVSVVRGLDVLGGASYLIIKAIRKSRVIAFEDLGMEAIYEFEVDDMPVTVAVDSSGESMHESGPRQWRAHIAGIPVTVAQETQRY